MPENYGRRRTFQRKIGKVAKDIWGNVSQHTSRLYFLLKKVRLSGTDA